MNIIHLAPRAISPMEQAEAAKPFVFIVGPFTALRTNPVTSDAVANALESVRLNTQAAFECAAMLAGAGVFYVCPHLNHIDMHGQAPRGHWLAANRALLAAASAVVLLPSWEYSEGAKGLADYASAIGKPMLGWPAAKAKMPQAAAEVAELMKRMYHVRLAETAHRLRRATGAPVVNDRIAVDSSTPVAYQRDEWPQGATSGPRPIEVQDGHHAHPNTRSRGTPAGVP